MIATSLEALKNESPNTPVTIALESQKDSNDPKGIAARNAKTKERFKKSNISVYDIHGQSRHLQNPPGKEDGVSHAKLIIVGNTIIAGSNNLTKQSTDVGANNEMNMAIQSEVIANTLREYVN
jgi:phosphatidylserine/phosphatidylglycerophosphate/cardiolipin synthase-like enzyme